jgi:hypothetical protein
MPEIVHWGTLKGRFQDGLLLGNGASMAVHAGFGYESLFKEAVRIGAVNAPVQEIFNSFNTDDFELVLRRLWYATLVNSALKIAPGLVEDAYKMVRSALIATIRSSHVSYADALPHLEIIFPFMKHFKTVVSLNYDLIVYWAAMLGNATCGRWFKDAFNENVFRENWEAMRQPYGADGATLFFYPHGNLVLARNKNDYERKIAGNGLNELLEAILSKWTAGAVSPIFVCEGTADHKKKAVDSSSYLRTVFREVIPSLGESLVIYGWSMSDQDQHIVAQLGRANLQRVAVSVRNDDQAYAQRVEETIHAQGIRDIVFFDSSSAGCWNNPEIAVQT